MNSIPKDKIKTGLYKYVSKAHTSYIFHIFKEYNKIISFYYTDYPIYNTIWKTLYEIDIDTFSGSFYKVNTGV